MLKVDLGLRELVKLAFAVSYIRHCWIFNELHVAQGFMWARRDGPEPLRDHELATPEDLTAQQS